MKTMIHKTGFDIGFNHTCKRGNQLKKHPLLGAQSYSNELFVFVHNFELTVRGCLKGMCEKFGG